MDLIPTIFVLRSRLGAPKAITATAHKLARIVYGVLQYGMAYQKRGKEEFVEGHRRRQERTFHRRGREMGYAVTKIELPPADAALGGITQLSVQSSTNQAKPMTETPAAGRALRRTKLIRANGPMSTT